MGRQEARQRARRQVRERAEERRREQLARERRIEDLGVRLVLALEKRADVTSAADLEVGRALADLVDREGLTLSQALSWTGGDMTLREATRLRRLATPSDVGGHRTVDRPQVMATDSPARTQGAVVITRQGSEGLHPPSSDLTTRLAVGSDAHRAIAMPGDGSETAPLGVRS